VLCLLGISLSPWLSVWLVSLQSRNTEVARGTRSGERGLYSNIIIIWLFSQTEIDAWESHCMIQNTLAQLKKIPLITTRSLNL
jgi:hypothetical protein